MLKALEIIMIRILLCIIFLTSCSGLKTREEVKKENPNSGKRPVWVNNKDEFCKANQLCAVGEGAGPMAADANARKEMSKIFETKVKSSSTFITTGESTLKDDVVSGESKDDYYQRLEETSEQLLKGVEIVQKYEGDDAIFSLAVLNKSRAAKLLKSEMQELDKEIRAYYKDGRRHSLFKALKLFKIRNNLNARYEFLSGRRFGEGISRSRILAKKKEKRMLGTTIFVDVKELGKVSEVEHLIIRQLLDNDFRVVTKSNKKFDFKVTGQLSKEKKHFNVDGFEKYQFMLQLKSVNGSGQKIGAVDFTHKQTGRSLVHAYESAKPEIRKYLRENLNELNID